MALHTSGTFAPTATSSTVYGRPKNRRFMCLGDSRLNLGMPRGDQAGTSVKDRGPLNIGIQFWAQFYSNGGMTFDEADNFSVSGSTSKSLTGATAGTPTAMGMLDYQLPLALASSTAGNALIITSTNERGPGNGVFTAAQSLQNIVDAATALTAKGVHVYIISEFPKGNPAFSPAYVIDYGVETATYSSPGSGYVVGDIITLTHAGLTPSVGGKYPKVKVFYVSGGGAYGAVVVDPGGYSASNAANLTNWTQLSTTGSGTGAVFTIAEGEGSGAQEHLSVHQRLNALQLPNVFVVDVWPDLLVSRDSLYIDPNKSADGVHLNTVGVNIVGRRVWETASVNLPPAPKPMGLRQRYDQVSNLGGNLLPPRAGLFGPVQAGTASIYNYKLGSTATTQPAVTGNTPNIAVIPAIDTVLMNAVSPAITLQQATDDPSWFEVRLSGTTNPAGTGGASAGYGGSFRLMLPTANANPDNLLALYAKLAAGDQVRATVECRIKKGAVGLTGVRLSIAEVVTTSAAYYAEHAGYPGAGGSAPGQGLYSVPWDPFLTGTGYDQGLLRTGILPVSGGQSFNLCALQIDLNSGVAYDVTIGFRNWAVFKEV